jgi:hypothetical protein
MLQMRPPNGAEKSTGHREDVFNFSDARHITAHRFRLDLAVKAHCELSVTHFSTVTKPRIAGRAWLPGIRASGHTRRINRPDT